MYENRSESLNLAEGIVNRLRDKGHKTIPSFYLKPAAGELAGDSELYTTKTKNQVKR
jgi:hypothetical protein